MRTMTLESEFCIFMFFMKRTLKSKLKFPNVFDISKE